MADPASELAPAIAAAIKSAAASGRRLDVIAVVSGTDEDPQGMDKQTKTLEAAGARVETSNDAAARYAGRLVQALARSTAEATSSPAPRVDLGLLKTPMAAINVGLESFVQSLAEQGAQVIQVDWKPAAAGNERLNSILQRMKTH